MAEKAVALRRQACQPWAARPGVGQNHLTGHEAVDVPFAHQGRDRGIRGKAMHGGRAPHCGSGRWRPGEGAMILAVVLSVKLHVSTALFIVVTRYKRPISDPFPVKSPA